jgi:hypothetical protein
MQNAVEHAAVAARISEGLVTGRLPRKQPTTTWVGHGSGKVCDGCGAEVSSSTLEHEYEFEKALIRLHAECAKIWLAMVSYS